MTYTLGPWEATFLEADGHVIESSGWEINTPVWGVVAWWGRCGPIRKEADAHLIAAAPDLLDVLEKLVELVEAVREGEYEIGYYTTQPAKQIIAKARGRPPKEKG